MSTLKVDTVQSATTNSNLTLKGSGTGTVSLPTGFNIINANVTGNLSVTRSLAVGYTDGRVPQANLDVKGNAFISGLSYPTSDGTSGQLIKTDGSGTLSFTSHSAIVTAGDVLTFYSANTTGNVSLGRGLAVGYVGEKVPGANLDVNGNAYISGTTTLGTALTIASGGTGVTSLTDGGILLGSGTSAITAMGVLSDGQMIVGDGTTDPVAESGATLRTSVGVGTGDSPQFTAVNIGAATDTTVSRASAGDINVEGNLIYRAGGTDVPVADGGTGASSLTDGGVLLGSGTSAVTAMGVLTDGQMIVGDGTTDPVAESGATLRTSIGVGTGDTPQFYGANITGNASIIRNLVVGYANDKVPGANLDVNGNTYISTDLRVGQDLVVVRNTTIGLDLTISGNLTVHGNNFIVHANNLVIDDPIIVLAANLKSSQSPADDTGLLLNRGNKSNVFAGYDESSNSYVIAYTPTTANSSPIDIGSYSTTRVGALTADSLNVGSLAVDSLLVTVAQGGTGATSLTNGGVLLGSGTGAITALGVLGDGEVIVGDGTTDPVAESGATLRTSIGVGTGDSPQFTAVNIGAATDTTVARASAGDINVEGNLIYRAGGTDVPVTDGGTGASSFTDGYVLLGSGTGAITALNVTVKGSILAGDGSTDPQALAVGINDQVLTAASGETTGLAWADVDTSIADRSVTQAKLAENSVGGSKVRANVLTGGQIIGSVVGFQSNVSGNVSVSRSLAVGYTDGRVPQANLEVKGNTHITGATTIAGALTLGTDLAVAQGGTGASSLTDGGVLLGSGTSAVTAMSVLTDGQMIVGDGSTDPVAESGATLRTSVGVGTGDSPQFTAVNIGAATDTTVARASAGDINVEGNLIYRAGGTDVPVADGGTGASSLTDGGVLLGSGTSAVTAMGVLTDGQMIVGDGTTDPVAESGDTLRTSIGVGSTASGTVMQVYSANASGNVSVGRSLAVGYVDGRVPRANLDVKGNVYISGNVAIAGATNYPEDVKAVFGSQETGPLQIYHSSGDVSRIEDLSGTSGGLYLRSSSTYIRNAADNIILAAVGDAAQLRYNGVRKLYTSSDGVFVDNSIDIGFSANVTGNVSVTRSLAIGYADGRVPQANLDVSGNVFIGGVGSLKTGIDTLVTFATGLGVASGGTGASSLTDGGVLLGSGTSAVTAMGVLSDSQMIVGDGSTDPVAESGTTLRTSIGVGTGDNVEFTNVTSTGVILAADGSVGAPSITNTGDTNTGIWYPAADTIAVSTGGAEAIRISGVGQNTTFSSHVVSHKGLAISNYTEYANNIVNAGSSFTVSTGTNISRYTLNSSHCEITLPAGQPINPASMKTIILYLKQDGTGGRTVDFNAPEGETLEWNNSASEPEVVSGASKATIYTFMKFHGDTIWYCAQSFIEN